MSALTIIGNVTSRLGISAPTAVFSSTDDQVIQLRNLMNLEGQELGRSYPWTKLLTEKTFTTVAAAIQTSAIPSDFDWYVNDTMWNRTTAIQVDGPLDSVEWQSAQASAVAAIPSSFFRFQGANLLIYPTPTAGQTVAYEYVSRNWAQTSGSVALSAMTADTDTALLDEAVIALGVLWRFLAAKGLDYAEVFRSYEIEKAKAQGRDGGKKTYSLSGYTAPRYNGSIKEGSWP